MIMNYLTTNILIASDHAGFALKQYLLGEIFSKDLKIEDLGAYSDEAVDYPDLAKILCEKIIKNHSCFGILICGSGIGMSIAANRFKGIRAALCYSSKAAKLARQHNDANVLVLGSRFINQDRALQTVNTFLSEKFEGGRHERRIEIINSF